MRFEAKAVQAELSPVINNCATRSIHALSWKLAGARQLDAANQECTADVQVLLNWFAVGLVFGQTLAWQDVCDHRQGCLER